MSKVLYSFEKEMPTVAIIRNNVMSNLAETGLEVRFKQLATITDADLNWCDVVFFIRPNDPYSLEIAKIARAADRYVIAYYDDDLYGLPSSLPNPSWRKNAVRKMLKRANLMETSSPHIAKKYAEMGGSLATYVAHTCIDASELKPMEAMPLEADGKVKLVYAANPGHVGFFNRFILPIMPKLCDQYGDKISMTFMGLQPDLSAFADRMEIHYIPGMPLEQYRKTISEGNYDIGLSPLISDEFTKCKYFNKFIEYAMAGIVGVYSNTEPYTYIVEHGVNGFLAEDTEESWFAVLSQAIDDARLRRNCICAAQKLLLSEFNRETMMARQMKEMHELFFHRAEGVCGKSLRIPKLKYKFIRIMDKIYLLLFYLRRGGIASVMQKLRKGY